MARYPQHVDIERHELSDSEVRLGRLGWRYSVTRIFHTDDLTAAPDVWVGLKRADAYRIMTDIMRRDVFDL